MARGNKLRNDKPFMQWALIVVTAILLALNLIDPKPLHWWQYMGLAVLTLLSLHAAYQLIAGRKPNA